jgi:hypothetical protein
MVFGYLGNGMGGPTPFPLWVSAYEDDMSASKIAHDMYNVYVNDDYVGKKILVAQGEKVEDINSFLKTRGFGDFDVSLKGNSYSISCKTDESRHMKDALSVYLSIR